MPMSVVFLFVNLWDESYVRRRSTVWILYETDKTRLISIINCNSKGLKELSPMKVEELAMPRSVGRKSETKLEFDYNLNQKAYVNQDLVYSWLYRFETIIGR